MRPILAIILTLFFASAVHGNDLGGGMKLSLDTGLSVVAADSAGLTNQTRSDGSYFLKTLGFGVLSETRTQSFAFNLDVGANKDGLERSEVGLHYSREAASSRFNFVVSDRKLDAGSFGSSASTRFSSHTFDIQPLDGDLDTTDVLAEFETGSNAPLGLKFSGRHSKRTQSSATTNDATHNRIKAAAVFRRSGGDEAQLSFEISDFESSGIALRDQRQTLIAVEFKRAITRRTRLDLQFGHRLISTRDAVTMTDRSGFEGKFSLTRDMPRGHVYALAQVSQYPEGRGAELRVGGELKSASSSLSGWVGIADPGHDAVDLIAGVSFSQTFGASELALELERAFTTSADTNDRRLTHQLELNYGISLGDRSRIDLGLDYSETDQTAEQPQQYAAGFRAIYSLALKKDWHMKTGFQSRHYKTAQNSDKRSRLLFLTIERSFKGGL